MKYASYECQKCGAAIGWLGRFLIEPLRLYRHRCEPLHEMDQPAPDDDAPPFVIATKSLPAWGPLQSMETAPLGQWVLLSTRRKDRGHIVGIRDKDEPYWSDWHGYQYDPEIMTGWRHLPED